MGADKQRSEHSRERDATERQPDGDPGDPSQAESEDRPGDQKDAQQPPQDERGGGYGGSTGGAKPSGGE